MRDVRSADAWVCGWRESNFGMGRVGPQNFGAGKKNGSGQDFGVDEIYDLMNFYYDSMKFFL